MLLQFDASSVGCAAITPNYSIAESKMKVCKKCGVPRTPEEFYKRTDRPGKYSWCKTCFNALAAIRDRKRKLEAISHMGGKCQHCGYSKCIRALEFHHKDRTTKSKEFKHSGWRKWSWARVVEELNKCILLCANCHREEEERIFGSIVQ